VIFVWGASAPLLSRRKLEWLSKSRQFFYELSWAFIAKMTVSQETVVEHDALREEEISRQLSVFSNW